jgi:hypothetical protein
MNRCLLRGIALALASLVAAGARPAAGQTTIDFTPASELDLFTQAELPSELVNDGVGGSDGVRIAAGAMENYPSSSLIYHPHSFDFLTPAAAIELSMMFRYDEITLVSNGGGIVADVASLHLLSDPALALTTTSVSAAYEVTQGTPSGPITHQLSVFGRAGGSGQGQLFPITPLVDDHWYQLRSDFSHDGTGRTVFDIALVDFGLSGASPVQTHFSTTHTLPASAPGLLDASVWAAYRMGRSHGGGNAVSDNFTLPFVVPEPGTASLAGWLLMAAVCAARGRPI